VQRALDFVRDGETLKDAALKVGYHERTVGEWVKRAGIESPHERKRRERLDQYRADCEARRVASEARRRAAIEARKNPPPEVRRAIVAMFNEGREDLGNGFVLRGAHNRKEILRAFRDVDPHTVLKIIDDARGAAASAGEVDR
jgi:hypothetical protein